MWNIGVILRRCMQLIYLVDSALVLGYIIYIIILVRISTMYTTIVCAVE